MVLFTERLVLRKWEESDAESLYKYASDPEVGPIAGWPQHKSIEESKSVIKNVFTGEECYAVCLKETNEAIGAVELKLHGFTDMTDREDECELGYWVGKPHWGKGYIPEAAGELLRRGFEELGMTTIYCGYYDGNIKSKRCQEKLGFEYHHTTENLEVPLLNEIRTGHVNVLSKNHWVEFVRQQDEMKIMMLDKILAENPGDSAANIALIPLVKKYCSYEEFVAHIDGLFAQLKNNFPFTNREDMLRKLSDEYLRVDKEKAKVLLRELVAVHRERLDKMKRR